MRRIVHYALLAAVLLGAPLACAWLGGRRELLAGLLAFPPRTEDWGLRPELLWNMRKPFSWPAFAAMAACVLAAVAPLARRLLSAPASSDGSPPAECGGARRPLKFPWFGWLGVALGAGAWALAWSRAAWFAPLQAHTFLPLWLAYVLVMNGLCARRTGRCLLSEHPAAYAALFPVSAAFWWFFEYLNRYVWNWYYLGVSEMGAAEYAFFATCSFSTVLPAVTATAECLASFRPFADGRLQGLARVDVRRPAFLSGLALVAAAGLAGVVFCPHLAYPLLWLSPLAVFLLLQVLTGDPTVLDSLRQGDWRLVARFAAASLLCGLFWEMWNYHSYAKWVYAVPYVHAFQLFEMPALGFAGYLPFGLECAAVSAWVLPALAGLDRLVRRM